MVRFGIGMAANNRPEYLDLALSSWDDAIAFTPADALGAMPFVRVEPGPHADAVVEVVEAHGWVAVRNEHRLGVAGNPAQVFSDLADRCPPWALMVQAEDDVVVAPDALRCLAAQVRAVECGLTQRPVDRTIFQLNHREPGALLGVPEPERAVLSVDGFSPSGWAITPGLWSEIRGDWGNHEIGWDYHLHRNQAPALGVARMAPNLSRSDHIGLHGGEHTTPESFAQDRAPTFDPGSRVTRFRYVQELP